MPYRGSHLATYKHKPQNSKEGEYCGWIRCQYLRIHGKFCQITITSSQFSFLSIGTETVVQHIPRNFAIV